MNEKGCLLGNRVNVDNDGHHPHQRRLAGSRVHIRLVWIPGCLRRRISTSPRTRGGRRRGGARGGTWRRRRAAPVGQDRLRGPASDPDQVVRPGSWKGRGTGSGLLSTAGRSAGRGALSQRPVSRPKSPNPSTACRDGTPHARVLRLRRRRHRKASWSFLSRMGARSSPHRAGELTPRRDGLSYVVIDRRALSVGGPYGDHLSRV